MKNSNHTDNKATKNVRNWLVKNYDWLLILIAFYLFTDKALYNIPISIMAVIVICRSILNPVYVFSNTLCLPFILLFMCFWLPQLLSLTDAVQFERAAKTTFAYLRFLFAGIFVISVITNEYGRKMLMLGLFVILSFWSIDAILQFLIGINLFGYPYETNHLSGAFYPKNTIGLIFAISAPIYIEQIRQYSSNKPWLWLLIIPFCMVILLSGSRSAWMLFAFCMVFYFLVISIFLGKRKRKATSIALFTSLLVIVLLSMFYSPLQKRIFMTVGVFSSDKETVEHATSRRTTLWSASQRIFSAHWINGVGPRGFRAVYPEYAHEGDYFANKGQTHPHMQLLEIASETGVLGLLGYLIFIIYLLRLSSTKQNGLISWAWTISIFSIIFPLNAHMAFYGSYWSSILWIFVSLGLIFISVDKPLPVIDEYTDN